LEYLSCINNQLATLTVSGCTALIELYCYSNQLTTLNVSGCTTLEYLLCYENQLTALNISGCTALSYLFCYSNQLVSTAINTVFTDLPDRTNTYSGLIYVGNNSGSTTCTPSIAQLKNWTINDTYYSGTSPMKSKMQMPEHNKKLRIRK
jgi:hypothetical protein